MTLDNRIDLQDNFYLREKVKKLQDEISHHQESHAVANDLLMEERNKISTLQSTIKFEVAEKMNAYKSLKCATSLVEKLRITIDKMDKVFVQIDTKIKKEEKEKEMKVIMGKLRKVIYELRRKYFDYRAERKDLDNVFEIK